MPIVGIQIGTLFAFSNESGFTAELKRSVLESALRGEVAVRTDPLASPTGYPFKVVTWSGDKDAGIPRKRICDMGYLRTAYAREDGKIGFRCASEPIEDYVKKGGDIAETTGRRCLCNSLMANVNIGQFREDGFQETQLLTSGDDLTMIAEFLQGEVDGDAQVLVSDISKIEEGRLGTLSFLANGYSVKYVPIEYKPRAGESKFHWYRDTKRYLIQVIRLVLSYNLPLIHISEPTSPY